MANEFSKIGTNTGHGHAWKRPDGVRMRCGGARICPECAKDFALVVHAQDVARLSVPVTPPKAPARELVNTWSDRMGDGEAQAKTLRYEVYSYAGTDTLVFTLNGPDGEVELLGDEQARAFANAILKMIGAPK